MMRMGVLALQGAVSEHIHMAGRVGALGLPVKNQQDLNGVDALIIPGGESTAISRLIRQNGLAEAIRDADIFIGTSIAGALTPELAATMAKDAIVFAMANPTPEIMPDLAKQAGVRVIGTGRSDFPNQVNNVLAFPGIFKGALSVRARDINPAMKMAAAKAIAGLIPDDELNEENILPKAFDPRVADAVAAAVAQAARESGVARV